MTQTLDDLRTRIDGLSTARILEGIRLVHWCLGPEFEPSSPCQIVRAELLRAYGERQGEDALDALLDELGL